MFRSFGVSRFCLFVGCLIAVSVASQFQVMRVASFSMEPTLHSGNYILVESVGSGSLMTPSVKRGDIIVFRSPYSKNEFLTKRVIAIGGDRIRITQGVLFLNGTAQKDLHGHYSDAATAFWPRNYVSESASEILVLPGHYFVMGDNRDASLDSRDWGFLPAGLILGIVRFDLNYFPSGGSRSSSVYARGREP